MAQVVPAGDPAVYARIGTLTDCAALQAEWQQAVALGERTRHGTQPHQEALGYVAAAEARMADCGCM